MPDIKGKERKIQESPRPVRTHALVFFPLLLEKEVIQPHLPVRLPCYDFTLLTKRTFDSVLPCGLDYRLRVPPTRMV